MVRRNAAISPAAPITSAIATTIVATAVVIARMLASRLTTSSDQSVPGATNSFDHRLIAMQFGAKSAHVNLDDVGIAFEVEIPYVVQDVAFRQHLVGMMQQVLEDRELAAGELDLFATQPHPSGRRVKPKGSLFEHRRSCPRTSSAQCPQPRNKNGIREGLGQVVVGAGVQTLDLIPDAVLRGQHQDRCPIAFAAQRLAYLVAV